MIELKFIHIPETSTNDHLLDKGLIIIDEIQFKFIDIPGTSTNDHLLDKGLNILYEIENKP